MIGDAPAAGDLLREVLMLLVDSPISLPWSAAPLPLRADRPYERSEQRRDRHREDEAAAEAGGEDEGLEPEHQRGIRRCRPARR